MVEITTITLGVPGPSGAGITTTQWAALQTMVSSDTARVIAVQSDSAQAINFQTAAGVDLVRVNAAGRFLNLLNGTDLAVYSDNGTTQKALIDGATGAIQFGGATGPGIYFGSGSPEAVVTARIGSLYLRTDGAAGTTLYKKTSTTGNTGWTAS